MQIYKSLLDIRFMSLYSDAYTTQDIVYVWDVKPLDIHHDAADILPNFFIKDVKNSSCTSVTTTGTVE